MKLKILMMFTMTVSLFAKVITIDKAIDLAIKQGEEVSISTKSLNISQKELNSAFKTALPNLFYVGGYLKTDGAFLENTPIQTAKSGYVNFIGISQPIFQGGAITAKIKKAKIEERRAALALLKNIRDTRLEVISIYTGILSAKNSLEAYNISKEQLNEALKYEEEKEKVGKTTKADLLKAEYQLLDMEASILEVHNQIEIGLLILKQKLNLSNSESIDVENFYINGNILKNIDYDIDLNQALTSGIAANFAQLNVSEADVEKMLARSEMLPHVKGFVGKEYVTEDHRTENSWGGGVIVNWNIFQFGKDYDNYEAAHIGVEKSKSQERLAQNDIRVNVRSAYLDMVKLTKLERVYFKALEEAEENYNRDKIKFQKGMISILDFLISQEVLTTSRVKYENIRLTLYNSLERYRSLLI